MIYIYYPTHTRMGSWFVGVILGYILYRTKFTKISIPKVNVFEKLCKIKSSYSSKYFLANHRSQLDDICSNNYNNYLRSTQYSKSRHNRNSISKCFLRIICTCFMECIIILDNICMRQRIWWIHQFISLSLLLATISSTLL